MRALALLAVLASPVWAEDPEGPLFDAGLLDVCFRQVQEQAPRGEAPDFTQCIGAASGPCMETPGGSSTYGMSYCLGEEYKLWDARLNDSYAHVLAGAKATDAQMAELGSAAEKQEPLLRQMQRHWIAFRDSACGFERSRWGGGTGAGPASVDCMVQLTAQQYLRLRLYEGGQDE